MKKIIIAILTMTASSAFAVPTYLGTTNQDVTITSSAVTLPVSLQNSIPTGTNSIGTVGINTGTNSIGTVGLNTGTNNIGTVSGSTVTSILKDGSGNAVTVTGNRLDVNAVITSADVSISTVGIRGSQGTIITSKTQALGTSLLTVDTARANLDGLSFVYKSSDSMVVGGALTLTGKANQVDLQAIGNDCTFNIGGGDSLNVAKNTGESYNFDYTQTNLVVNLTAKSGSATCKVRITGAN